jgi:predicted acyl esterase
MRRRRTRNTVLAAAVALAALLAAPAGEAAIPSVFDGHAYGDPPPVISCTVQPANDDVRLCGGLVKTWDDTVIDVNVILPPDPGAGNPDGNYPLIGIFHGWGGSKYGIDGRTKAWALRGYTVFSMTDRGWGNSCGAADPKRLSDADTGCAEGYNHLLDSRFEVRDAQYLISLLADEGVIDGRRIGVTGPSYGGGMSMALAALRDRVMLPDGTYAPWQSPGGKPMRIAAAAPEIPWTDLAYSLQPNGHTLDYVADAPYLRRGRIGVLKQSFVAGLFALGLAASNYAPPGSDPDADLIRWYAEVNAGEPYDQNPLAADLVDEITTHHSSYYIDHSQPPAPLLISNGWTDDLFPADEAIRFYNRTRSEHPKAQIQLFFMDYGHQRGQNKAADVALLRARQEAWFDFYLRGQGERPAPGPVETLTQTCGGPSAGPYFGANWAKIAPGEVRLSSAGPQTILPVAGDPTIGRTFDPIAGGGACATATGADQPGTASYRLASGGGFTLVGSPTIVADINSPGLTSQVAARLLDVAPDGETLVARGLYRPEISSGLDASRQVFQLHPAGWRFEPGHTAKLELLPSDTPYGRISNGQLQVTVSNLELRIPVLEAPNGGLIRSPAPKVLPPGYVLAADFASSGGCKGKGCR